MAVTLTANYEQVLQPATVTKIKEYLDEGDYELSEMLKFIDEHSESEFLEYFGEYIECADEESPEAVDAFIKLYGPENLYRFSESFLGEFRFSDTMAQEYYDTVLYGIPDCLVIDWAATAENLLDEEVDCQDNFYFRTFR